MKRIIILIALIWAGIYKVNAQSSPNYYVTNGTNYTTAMPFYYGYPNYQTQMLYTPGEMSGGPFACGTINKFYIKQSTSLTGNGSTTFNNCVIKMGLKGTQTSINGSASPGNFYTDLVTVANYSSLTVNYSAGSWIEFPLQIPFNYRGGEAIAVEFTYTSASYSGSYYIGWFYCTPTANYQMRYWSTLTNSQGYGYTLKPQMGFNIIPATPTTPVAGYFAPPNICKNSPVTLLNTFNVACTDTAQWTITPNNKFSYVTGSNANSASPTVLFTDTGNFTVKLRINNVLGRDSITKIIHVDPANVAPTPDFVASRTKVARAADTVYFSDLSTSCPQGWSWSSPNYPGPNPILNPTQKNPKAMFNIVGNYDICLTASNTVGSNNTCKTNYIQVLPRMVACTDTLSRLTEGYAYDNGGPFGNYTPNLNSGNCKGLLIDPCAATVTINFESIGLGDGDTIFVHNGTSSFAPVIFKVGKNMNNTTPNVTASSGKMFIRFESNGSGEGTGYIARWSSTPGTYGKPTAAIAVPSVTGLGTDTFLSAYPIILINNSTGVDVSYSWDLNGDGVQDATTKNPTASFTTTTAVQKTIRLVAYNCKGYDTTYKTVTIVPVTQKPVNVDFVASKTNVAPTDTIYLTDLSKYATSWDWTFIPSNVVQFLMGTTKNSQNPVISIAANGCVTAQLKAQNSFGNDIALKVCYFNGRIYCVPGTIAYTSPDLGISRVKVGQIDNTSPAGQLFYHSYIDSAYGSTTMYKNGTYSITIARPTAIDSLSRKAWIDYNMDGDFNDAGEMILHEQSTLNLSSTFNFTVPVSTGTGESILRVGTSYARTLLDPCASQVGEFEDYKIIFAKDVVKPVITMLGSDTVSIEVNSTYTDAGATATDNLEGDITGKIVVTTQLDPTKVGFYTYCYDATDNYGNKADTKCRVVNVKVDLTPPSITLLGKVIDTILVHGTYTDLGATAFDNYSGNITNFIVKNSNLNVDSVGVFTIVYSVADYFGYTATKTRTIVVIDNVNPVITNNGTGTSVLHSVHIPLNSTTINKLVTVSDNYYKNIVPTITAGSVNVDVIGDYPVTFGAVDGSGNVAAGVSLTIMVRDTTRPDLNLNGPSSETIEVFSNYTEPTVTVSDNYDAQSKLVINRNAGGFNKNVVGNYNIVYTCTDSSGNVATSTRMVNVVDTQAPVITVKISDLINWPLGKPWVDPGVQIVDNFYSEQLLQDTPYLKTTGTVDVYMAGFYTLKYKVTDPSGNISNEAIRRVRVLVNGVDDVKSSKGVTLYPVPSNGELNAVIDPAFLNNNEQVEVTVYNMMGQKVNVRVSTNASNKLVIDMLGAASGTYYVKLSGSKLDFSQKINVIR